MPRTKSHNRYPAVYDVIEGSAGRDEPRKQPPVRLPEGCYVRNYALYVDDGRGEPIELMSRIVLTVNRSKYARLGKTLSIAAWNNRTSKMQNVVFAYTDLMYRRRESVRRLRNAGANIAENAEDIVMKVLAIALRDSEVRR